LAVVGGACRIFDGCPWLSRESGALHSRRDRQQHDAGLQLATHARLIGLRRGSIGSARRIAAIQSTRGDLLVFERRSPGHRLLCAFNLGLSERICGNGGARMAGDGVRRRHQDWSFPPLSGLIARWLP